MSNSRIPLTTLFLDIGGVLLTNGWDRHARKRAAEQFGIDLRELEERHHLIFAIYEQGLLSLDEYLARVVFHTKRFFTPEEFKAFMFEQSKPNPEMIDFVRELKRQYRLRIFAVSNEGREMTNHRIDSFDLPSFVDGFICSCFIRCRKPDSLIYNAALDIAHVFPEEVVYVDDRPLFIEVAQSLGIRGIPHRDFAATRDAFAALGLPAG